MEIKYVTVDLEDQGKRLDLFLSKSITVLSRSYIQRLIKEGKVSTQGKTLKQNYKVQLKDEIQITIPSPEVISLKPENILLDIIYEDEDIAVINKPQGMVVHPAPGNYSGTLVNALLYKCDNLSGINGKIRPGIVHRIDKDTSGLLVVAKNDYAHRNLAKQIKDKTAVRIYWAIVEYNFKDTQGIIDAPIARHPIHRKKMAVINGQTSRNAVTHYTVLENFHGYSLIALKLETGRTHQIRVHMSYIGHPVLGDLVYGRKKQSFNLEGQMLHAKKLGLKHPSTDKYMEFEAPLPQYFTDMLDILRNKSK